MPVDAILRDPKVLYIEEALLAEGSDKSLGEFLLALGGVVQTEIDGDEVCPVKVCLLDHA